MSCLLVDPDQSGQLDWALNLLRRNEPVGLPTETVYGLAARVASSSALARVFSLKARPHFDPLIMHVSSVEQARAWTLEMSDLQASLLDQFWPGPLTLLLKRNVQRIPDLCTAGSDWVAVRSPAHPIFRKILLDLGEPLAAPSANRFGRVSPTRAVDVVSELGPFGLEAVVDGGACAWGVESTIIAVEESLQCVRILRPGALALEKLQDFLGSSWKFEKAWERQHEASSVLMPGTLESHYAPRTPLLFLDSEEVLATILSEGTTQKILLSPYGEEHMDPRWLPLFRKKWQQVFILSREGRDTEAAAGLFRTLRECDLASCEQIVALKMPEAGLGCAVNDRLRRAGR